MVKALTTVAGSVKKDTRLEVNWQWTGVQKGQGTRGEATRKGQGSGTREQWRAQSISMYQGSSDQWQCSARR